MLKLKFFPIYFFIIINFSLNLFAGISPLAFKGIFKNFRPGFEYLAPNIGALALKNGTIEAIRFFNVIPGPNNEKGSRHYIKDRAPKDDPAAALAILLFPSPAGQLSAITNHKDNLGAKLELSDLAFLLDFCAHVRAVVQPQANAQGYMVYAMGGNEFGKSLAKNLFRLKAAAKHQLQREYFSNLIINPPSFLKKLAKAQNLMAYICQRIELEERADRLAKKYLEASFYAKGTAEMLLTAFFSMKFGHEDIKHLIKNLSPNFIFTDLPFEQGLITQQDLEQVFYKSSDSLGLDDFWILQNQDLIDAIIPYENQSQPINNGTASAYDRNKDMLLNDSFADCTESLLRHLLNLVLYSKTHKIFQLENALKLINDPKNRENFAAFYALQGPEDADSGAREIRDSFSKIVNNLPGNIRYNNKFVSESSANDNELDSGLLNIMRVLNTIFDLNLEKEPQYINDDQFAEEVELWVKRALKIVFRKLSPNETKAKIKITDIKPYLAEDDRMDCSGDIKVSVGKDYRFFMSIEEEHAQFNLIKTKKTLAQPKSDLSTFYAWSKQASSINQLFSMPVNDSQKIIYLLEKLYEKLQSQEISINRAKLILTNALSRFLWSDAEISKRLQGPLKKLFELNEPQLKKIIFEESQGLYHLDFLPKSAQIQGELFPKLNYIDLEGMCLGNELELTGNFSNLKNLSIHSSSLKNLKLIDANLPELNKIELFGNQKLNNIKIKNSRAPLEYLSFPEPSLKSLKILNSKLTGLKNIYLNENVAMIKIEGFLPKLENLNLGGRNIKHLKLFGDGFTALKTISLNYCELLKHFEISGTYPLLENIEILSTPLKFLNLNHARLPSFKKLQASSLVLVIYPDKDPF